MKLVNIVNGQPMVSSKDVAERFGKIHRIVMRAIDGLDCSAKFRSDNFVLSSYTSPQNKVFPCFLLTQNGFSFLCMGFTGKKAGEWKEKYINAFDQMAKTLQSAPATMADLNEITAKIEKDKNLASLHGRELAKYKKVKKCQEAEFEQAVSEAQQALGF